MSKLGPDPGRPFASASLAGTWEWQLGTGGVVLDRGSAELLAGNAELAGEPLDLDASFACLHPDDRERVYALVNEHEQRGGPIAMQYRVRSPDGRVRWLMDRGQIIETADGTRLGYGLLLDITDMLATEHVDAGWEVASLAELADVCLGLRDAAVRYGTSTISLLFDMLLLELGRELARHEMKHGARMLQ